MRVLEKAARTTMTYTACQGGTWTYVYDRINQGLILIFLLL